jgi:hypothetical protein
MNFLHMDEAHIISRTPCKALATLWTFRYQFRVRHRKPCCFFSCTVHLYNTSNFTASGHSLHSSFDDTVFVWFIADISWHNRLDDFFYSVWSFFETQITVTPTSHLFTSVVSSVGIKYFVFRTILELSFSVFLQHLESFFSMLTRLDNLSQYTLEKNSKLRVY